MTKPLSDEIVAGYELLRTGCGRISLEHERAYVLSGNDRWEWLQGQATNDLRSLTSGEMVRFCICTPTGQLLAILDSGSIGDRILLSTDRGSAAALELRVEQMVIIEEVELEPFGGPRLSVQGPSSTRSLGKWCDLSKEDAGAVEVEGQPAWAVRNNRTGLGGWDLWFSTGEIPSGFAKAFPVIAERAVQIAELEWGRPSLATDVTAKTLPPELGPKFEQEAISYMKGCYTGQEVLMRMHSRGHPNRCWVGLRSDVSLAVGAQVRHSSRPDAGVVTRSEFSPRFGNIAAAMVRSSIAITGEEVEVEVDGGLAPAQVQHFPFLRL